MSYPVDPFGRRRRMSRASQTNQPTLDDYRTLAQAFQQLQQQHNAVQNERDSARREAEKLRREFAQTQRELQIKNEALQRQSDDLKNLESELLWAKAALNSQEPRSEQQTTQPHDEEGAEVWKNRFARLQSELDSLRKRWEQRVETETTEARHRILRDMLPLADHLELALRHGEALSDTESREFLRNVEATHRAFLDTLRRYGVEQIDALGQPFDPSLHEAVGQIRQDDVAPETVVQIVQSGYQEGKRLLRPARVLISHKEHAETNE